MKSVSILLVLMIGISISLFLALWTVPTIGQKLGALFASPEENASNQALFPHSLGDTPTQSPPELEQEPFQLNEEKDRESKSQAGIKAPKSPRPKIDRRLITQELVLKLNSTQQASSHSPNDQYYLSAASLSNINFVICWVSDDQDGDGKGIYAQIYEEDGASIDDDFNVTQTTTNNQRYPNVVSFPDISGFVVVWSSQHTSKESIYGRLFSNNGTAITDEIQIFNDSSKDGRLPVAMILENDKAIVVWQTDNSGVYNIYGRFFDSAGTLLGSEFLINDSAGQTEMNPKVSSMPDGNFLVVWEDIVIKKAILGKIFDVDGNPVTSELRISSDLETDNVHPYVIISKDDSAYVIVWLRYEPTYSAVIGVTLDHEGYKIIEECELLTSSDSLRDDKPLITTLEDEGYIVMWGLMNEKEVLVRRFDQYLNYLGDAYTVNTELDNEMNALVGLDNEGFVMAWSASDGTSLEVYFKIAIPCEKIVPEEIGIGSTCPCADYMEIDHNGDCQCIYTNADQDTCLCSSDQYLDDTDCIDCSEDCAECDYLGCLECYSGYYLSNSFTCSTSACDELPNCSYCPSITVCQVCDTGYELDTNDGVCTFDECDAIENCLECEDEIECSLCEQGYFFYEETSTCVLCDFDCHECTQHGCECGEYFYSTRFSCEECGDYCRICEDSGTCYTCEEGFSINFDSQCVCQDNQKLENEVCVDLAITLIVEKDDFFIVFYFSEDIVTTIDEEVLTCFAFPSFEVLEPLVTHETRSIYEINFDSTIPDLTTGIEIHVDELTGISGEKFLPGIYIVSGSTSELKDLEFDDDWEGEDLEDIDDEVDEYVAPSSSSSMSITSIVLSILMQQYSAVWAFINSAQLLFYIPVHNIELPKAAASTYKVFGANFFEFISISDAIGIQNGKNVTSTRWKDYGFENSKFIMNTEAILFLGTISLSLLPMFLIARCALCRYAKASEFFDRRILDYKWCFFLRFWLEGYLDLMAAALLSANYTDSNIELAFSIFILTIGWLSVFFISLLIYKVKTDIENKEELVFSSYGTFFEEFKNNKGFFSMLFYPLFCLRRILYVFVLFYLENYPVFQVSINILCSFLTILYLIWFKPFVSNRIQNIVLSAEIIFCFNIIVCSLFLLNPSQNYKIALVTLILLSISVLVFINIFITVSSIVKSIKDFCNKRKNPKNKKITPSTVFEEPKKEEKSYIKVMDLDEPIPSEDVPINRPPSPSNS